MLDGQLVTIVLSEYTWLHIIYSISHHHAVHVVTYIFIIILWLHGGHGNHGATNTWTVMIMVTTVHMHIYNIVHVCTVGI